jgi:Rad3-related DNA helicase
MDGFSPIDIGMPDKFDAWRPHQMQATLDIVDAEERYVTSVCPTGFGKSPMYVAAALINEGRTVFLTSTKGLQDQLMKDFGELGMVEMKGRNAYRCRMGRTPETSCDRGPCATGRFFCKYKESGCLYYDALRRAQHAKLLSTNYACWMYTQGEGQGFGDEPFDMMVCDEAHDSAEMVASYLAVDLNRGNDTVRSYLPNLPEAQGMTLTQWKGWAASTRLQTEADMERLKDYMDMYSDEPRSDQVREYVALKRLTNDLGVIAGMSSDWIVGIDKFHYKFSPIWPKEYCEGALFMGIPKILFTSASICEKSVELMGVPTGDEASLNVQGHAFFEYPHSFPLRNRPLIHIPTIRLNFRSTEQEIKIWRARIDQIIDRGRDDRKGIVHTVSYKRRNDVLRFSKHQQIMITHKTGTAPEVVRDFKDMDPPLVLVSPSMTTGWDFPDDECRYQVIGKIAYPDTTDPITKARSKDDNEYSPYVAMQQLIQACGRGVRSATDWCETFIIDDNIKWFFYRYQHLAPEWFRGSLVSVNTIPIGREDDS